ncbi:MAG TPA: aminotransferase class III-fold pyridoxal phosphate-dependent enzyme, partial [Dissulfurispiraceae bacterium]|nr:aminotransferase class III-fold pyridoxal phosphate-dependent enzyme [Dissulfurispiraceae bacterium]
SHPEKMLEVRGKGLLLGVELTVDVAPVVKACMERGLLVGSAGDGHVIRFSPPLIIEKRDIDQAMNILDEVIDRLP